MRAGQLFKNASRAVESDRYSWRGMVIDNRCTSVLNVPGANQSAVTERLHQGRDYATEIFSVEMKSGQGAMFAIIPRVLIKMVTRDNSRYQP